MANRRLWDSGKEKKEKKKERRKRRREGREEREEGAWETTGGVRAHNN